MHYVTFLHVSVACTVTACWL